MTLVRTAAELDGMIRVLFATSGWPEEDCAELSRHLVGANLSGHDSHGVGMIPAYVEAILRGDLKPSNTPQDVIASGAFLVIDAHLALGQPVAANAVRRACKIAQEHGVCVLNLVNAHHIGRIGHYAELAVDERFVFLGWVNVAHNAPPVAPFGGMDGRLGTNPHCIGVPAAEPLILDFATSRIAMGKVRVARNKGEDVAPDILLDPAGAPTRDPAVMFARPQGALLAFGEHKGSGISIMAEVLAGLLGRGTATNETGGKPAIINNLLAILIDPARLGADAQTREQRMRDYLDYLRSGRPRDAARPVAMPGEPERISRATRLRDGIPIDETSWRQIVEAAAKLGVEVGQAG